MCYDRSTPRVLGIHKGLLVLPLVLVVVLCFGTSPALAVSQAVQLNINQSSSTLNMSVDAGSNGSDNDSTHVSGTVSTTLGIDFDPNTFDASLNWMTINQSGTSLATTSDLNFGLRFLFVPVTLTGSGIGGTVSGSGPVSGSVYTGSNYTITLNQGAITASIGGEVYNLGAQPIPAPLQNGTISISKTSQVGQTATYSVTMTAPVSITTTVATTSPVTVNANIVASGQVVASGSFQHTFPVPEPGSIAMLLGLGAMFAGYGLFKRRGSR